MNPRLIKPPVGTHNWLLLYEQYDNSPAAAQTGAEVLTVVGTSVECSAPSLPTRGPTAWGLWLRFPAKSVRGSSRRSQSHRWSLREQRSCRRYRSQSLRRHTGVTRKQNAASVLRRGCMRSSVICLPVSFRLRNRWETSTHDGMLCQRRVVS